jgi:O-acetylserine/cysteine efflux transporter
MRFRDAILAALTSVIWGLAFVATKLGLEGFSAAELTALRFLIGCLPRFWYRGQGLRGPGSSRLA